MAYPPRLSRPAATKGMAVMTNMSSPIVRQQDRYYLPVQGATVGLISLDYRLHLDFFDAAPPLHVAINCPFTLNIDGKTLTIDPETPGSVAPALCLLRQSIDRATVSVTGDLELIFANKLCLIIPSHHDYEAWETYSDDGARYISLPGGSVAIWDPDVQT